MNLAYLSKEELLVVLVGFKNLNKRNCAVIETDLYKFNHESNEENFNKYLTGVNSLYQKDFAEISNSDNHERLIYSYSVDREKNLIRLTFGQCIRTIYSSFNKNIDDVSLSSLEFNNKSSKVLLGMLVTCLKKRKSSVLFQAQEFNSHFPGLNNLKIRSQLKKACSEISKNSPVNLHFDLDEQQLLINIEYKKVGGKKRQVGCRDLNTNDMFNGLSESDINSYLKNILKDQYFYLMYSKVGENKNEFSKRIRALITCNDFPLLKEDVDAVKKILNVK